MGHRSGRELRDCSGFWVAPRCGECGHGSHPGHCCNSSRGMWSWVVIVEVEVAVIGVFCK